MKLNQFIIALLSFLSLSLNAQDKIFEKIENRTWFDETGFAGVTVVFIKSGSGQIQAIRQINGSGVPVIATEVYNVEIRRDTVYLLSNINEQAKEMTDTVFYTYNEQQGLSANGKQLRILFEVPYIYVCTEERKIMDTRLNVNALTKTAFYKNEVYINDKVYKINRED